MGMSWCETQCAWGWGGGCGTARAKALKRTHTHWVLTGEPLKNMNQVTNSSAHTLGGSQPNQTQTTGPTWSDMVASPASLLSSHTSLLPILQTHKLVPTSPFLCLGLFPTHLLSLFHCFREAF